MYVLDGFKARRQVSELQTVRSCLLTSSDNPSSGQLNIACVNKSIAMETPPESMSTEWTDEKHSMYLKSMEASFVNDLYDSMELLGWCPEKKDVLLSKSSNQTRPKPSSSSGQFEVLRGGSWGKVHFDRARSQAVKANRAGNDLLSNPWILHFKSTGEPRAPASREINRSDSKKAIPRWGASSSSTQFRIAQQDTRCNEAEASGQNFDEEEEEEGENVKRVRTQELGPYSPPDQVVPHHKRSHGREKHCKSSKEDDL